MKECPTCRNCYPDDVAYCPEDGIATTPSISGEPILDGRYQLEKRLGQGGMGVVFKARHIFLKTQHAIKIILPDLVGNDPNLVTRFRQEALAAAAIRHQNIIAVTDFGVVRGTMPFLVMEFVHGRSLQDIMGEEGAMAPARALELMQPICAGIAAAHRQKIVHRDLKPLNVMIQDDIPTKEGTKILDFGLAKIKSGELLGSFVAAQTTGLMGSPFYMAPEQWGDDPPDTRADVYSLGVMLYQMLSGEVPFKGSSIPSIMKKHLTAEVPTFASKGIEVPRQIEAVVRHALEKDPKYRTPSADEFAQELGTAMSSASARLKRTGESSEIDPSKTLVSAQPEATGSVSQTKFDPMAGTISGHSLIEDEEKTRIAREELAREAEARRRLTNEEERRRQEEESEKEEERRHLEEIVAKQTKVLEEKLTQLAATMSPKETAVVDPDATQLKLGGGATVGDNSYQNVPGFARAEISLTGPRKRSSLPLILGLGVVLLIGASVGAVWYFRTRPVKPPEPHQFVYKPEFITIPSGTFSMGRNGATLAELPVHSVTVKPFVIDKTEVTNAEYEQFVRETNYTPPSNWVGAKPIQGQELLPVTFVSVDDASAFAVWRSRRDGVQYRLPTEEEWEYAARGGDQDNIYSWGNTWVDGNAVTKSTGVTMPKPVGSAPDDKTRWGVMDMIGNVYEWTSTKANYYEGSSLTVEGEQRSWYVVRGASFATDQTPKPISATRRDWFSPTTKVSVLGFRLVRSA